MTAKISLPLKRLLNKKEVIQFLSLFEQSVNANIAIIDIKGNRIYGKNKELQNTSTIAINGHEIGQIKSDKSTRLIDLFLTTLGNLEIEKRQLANDSLLKNKELNLLYRLADKLSTNLSPEKICQIAIKEIKKFFKQESISIILKETSRDIYKLAACSDGVVENTKKYCLALKSRPEITDKCPKDITSIPVHNKAKQFLCSPIKVQEKFIGTICLTRDNNHPFTAGDLKLISSVSSQIAAPIESARQQEYLEQLVSIRTAELSRANKQLQEANNKLQLLSTTDPLTGIYNRRYFDTILNKEWKRCLRYSRQLSIIMIDIDYFKKYNDFYGHLSGDECLKKVATGLAACIERESDCLARFGGEEFIILLPETGKKGALKVAEKLQKNINGLRIPHEPSHISDHVTISIGIASAVCLADINPEDIILAADNALYSAKEEGRNRIKQNVLNEKK
jgi:diguanylate cyclase (GGDEF)-like protein